MVYINWYGIFYFISWIGLGIGLISMICGFLSYETNYFLEFLSFVKAGTITIISSLSVGILTFDKKKFTPNRKDIFVLTTLLWMSSAFFAGIPLYYIFSDYSLIDGIFDATSSLTTTGCYTHYGTPPIILWRSFLQWIGGIGMIMMVLAFFPIGGIQFFRTEFLDKSDKVIPKLSHLALSLLGVYGFLTALSTIGLKITSSLDWWICFVNAVSAISTTGLFVHLWNLTKSTQIILMVSMFLGGCSFLIFIKFLQKDFKVFSQDPQFKMYIFMMVSAIFLILFLCLSSPYNVMDHIFMTISFLSTTGYAPVYAMVPHSVVSIFIVLGLIGGCGGSTSGGIKIYRIYELFLFCQKTIRSLLFPHEYVPEMGKMRKNNTIVTFLLCYVVVFLMIMVSLTYTGIDMNHSFAYTFMAIGNLGDGILSLLNMSFDFMELTTSSKLILIHGMIIGRLEILSIIILFIPSFWKDQKRSLAFNIS